jgi:dTDP-4-dehydrorhamnose reductase
MKILLLGANGQVGWELARTLALLGNVVTVTRGGASDLHLDLTDQQRLAASLDALSPDVIVNAAAYTAVDRAESEVDLAMQLNAGVPGLIGRWAAANGALVIHYSTDYVFDGSKPESYVETDTPNPLNVYGRSKLAGDEALLDSGCKVIILRVSWVYGLRGANFLQTMRRLMQEREELSVVDDQLGAPTWSRSIAQATTLILARLPDPAAIDHGLSGVYHFAPSGATSWFGFAEAIRAATGADCRLSPIPASDYPTAAQRPANSRLASDKLTQAFGIVPLAWEKELMLCLQQIDV